MSKSLIYLALGALALTACTSEDVIDNVTTSTRNVIKFENVVNKHSRADITSDELVHFNVFGFYTMPGNDQLAHRVFYNTSVDRDDKNAKWEYTGGERYWVPGAKYYFYAYSCDNTAISEAYVEDIKYTLDMEGNKSAENRVLEIQNYICNNNHQHDLIFASNTGAIEGNQFAGLDCPESGNTPVSLEFKHILSKVRAKFTTQFPEEYEIVISNITIENIRDKGNYDILNKWHSVTKTAGAKALTLLGGSNSLMIKNDKVGEEGNKTQMSAGTDQFYVIPCGSDDPKEDTDDATEVITVALKFTIDVYIGENRDNKVMSKTLTGTFAPGWEEGYQYVYNVDINGTTTNMQVIAFETSVDGFNNEQSKDITDFNVEDHAI